MPPGPFRRATPTASQRTLRDRHAPNTNANTNTITMMRTNIGISTPPSSTSRHPNRSASPSTRRHHACSSISDQGALASSSGGGRITRQFDRARSNAPRIAALFRRDQATSSRSTAQLHNPSRRSSSPSDIAVHPLPLRCQDFAVHARQRRCRPGRRLARRTHYSTARSPTPIRSPISSDSRYPSTARCTPGVSVKYSDPIF